jgi:hypothetical protein
MLETSTPDLTQQKGDFMSALSHSNSYSSLTSTSGTFGVIQIAATQENVVLDVQARNYDSAGHLHRDHALANLSLATAARLRDLLSEAIEYANSARLDVRQTSLWSENTRRHGWRAV